MSLSLSLGTLPLTKADDAAVRALSAAAVVVVVDTITEIPTIVMIDTKRRIAADDGLFVSVKWHLIIHAHALRRLLLYSSWLYFIGRRRRGGGDLSINK